MKVTAEFVLSGLDYFQGPWCKEQLAVLGVSWPPPESWLNRLVNSDISDAAIDCFLEIKRVHRQTRAQEWELRCRQHEDALCYSVPGCFGMGKRR